MEHLLKGRFFSWLKEGTREMTDEQIEAMVLEFVDGLVKWSEGVRDYCEVARGLESMRIRLQVWDEVCQAGNGTEKNGALRACRVVESGARDAVGAGTVGMSGMVCGASG